MQTGSTESLEWILYSEDFCSMQATSSYKENGTGAIAHAELDDSQQRHREHNHPLHDGNLARDIHQSGLKHNPSLGRGINAKLAPTANLSFRGQAYASVTQRICSL